MSGAVDILGVAAIFVLGASPGLYWVWWKWRKDNPTGPRWEGFLSLVVFVAAVFAVGYFHRWVTDLIGPYVGEPVRDVIAGAVQWLRS